MFTARYASTPDGLVRKNPKIDRVKTLTHEVATRKTKLPENSRKRVFFIVTKTNEVRCWPYNNFLTLLRSAHPGEVRLADERDLGRIHGDPDDFAGDVNIPQSQVDRFVDNFAMNATGSALDFVAKMKKEAAKRAGKERRAITKDVPRIKPSKAPKIKKQASKPKKEKKKASKKATKPKKSAAKKSKK